MLGELEVQIPDLLRIKPANQEAHQIRDLRIDLEIDVFLTVGLPMPVVVAKQLPCYGNLRRLLQNPFAEKEVIEFRQGVFSEIYRKELVDADLDHIGSELAFCAQPFPKSIYESLASYLARQEAELAEKVLRFKKAIHALDSLLQNASSLGLERWNRFLQSPRHGLTAGMQKVKHWVCRVFCVILYGATHCWSPFWQASSGQRSCTFPPSVSYKRLHETSCPP